eukprot:CAMPEP_0179262804 /NCGR_PEP_ID=MMETSP0797-20121207/27554_1 /TAXON_ID=47934 /ORGANISM="Dinophysis acuminata, Strain DAEP01" /LENGTH=517 /DNA_ID=CAMNT_0020970947 /DNA_START=1 /DNA_END=1555 /DNA_ORIENTATION=-
MPKTQLAAASPTSPGVTATSGFGMTGAPRRPDDRDASSIPRLLRGRKTYKVWTERILSEGKFGYFCPGQEVEAGTDVMVKIYKDTGNVPLKCFHRSLAALTNVREKLIGGRREGGEQDLEVLEQDLESMGSGSRYGSASFIVSQMEFKHNFVELLDHSLDRAGEPGLDPESGLCYIVQEMGEVTLQDEILWYVTEGRKVPLGELRKLQWDLVSMVCSLHSEGLVNLDIAPRNVMKFRLEDGHTQWRLIDFDGAVKPNVGMSLFEVPVVPEYMPPEYAGQYLQSRREPCKLKAMRNMDVWSAALCGLEPVLQRPVLGDRHNEIKARTGSDTKFLAWLAADGFAEPVMSAELRAEVHDLCPDMCNLLEGMLEKDHKTRLSVTHCVTHRFFMPFQRLLLEASWDSAVLQSIDDAEAALKAKAEEEELQNIIEESKVEHKDDKRVHASVRMLEGPEEMPQSAMVEAWSDDSKPRSNSKIMAKSCAVIDPSLLPSAAMRCAAESDVFPAFELGSLGSDQGLS